MAVSKATRSIVRKNSTGSEYSRRRLNLIEGSNVTLTVSDDSTDNEIDVTIASSGGGGTPGGSDTQVQFNDSGSFGGDAGLTYNKTSNILDADGGYTINGTTLAGSQALLVAASDAPTTVKNRADYVCDGTDDDVQIQAALDAAGEVVLSGGTFTIGTTIYLDTNDSIVGQGQTTTLIAKTNLNAHIFSTNSGSSVYFVQLKDFRIDGNRTNQSSGTAHGIFAQYAHTWLMENLHIKETRTCGIRIEGNSSNIALNNRVINCRLENTGEQCLFIGGYAPNNHFVGDILGASYDWYAIECANDENIFVDCHIHGAYSSGIYVPNNNNIFQGCIVEVSGGHGWTVTGDGNHLIGCIAFNNAQNGFNIEGDYNRVTGCRAFDRQGGKTQDYGLSLASGAQYNIIANNSFLASDHTTGSIQDSSGNTTNTFLNNYDYNTSRMFGNHTIINSSASPAILIDQNANTGTTDGTSGALVIDMTGANGHGLQVYSNQSVTNGSEDLVHIETAHADWDRPLVRIIDNSTAGGAANIRIDSPNPDIELFESDQTQPAGSFEIAVNGDVFQINGRNAANTSFEPSVTVWRTEDGGMMGVGTDFNIPNAMIETVTNTGKAHYMASSSVGANSGDYFVVAENGYVAKGWATPTVAKLQLNSNATSPSSIDLTNTIAVGTGTGGANATSKFLGQFGWLSRDSSFTAPKLVAYIGGEATETYAADTDTGSRITFYTGTENNTNPTMKAHLGQDGTFVLGDLTTTEISLGGAGAVVINEQGRDSDFRVEGDTNTSLIHADASADKVGINKSDPGTKLDVNGSFRTTPVALSDAATIAVDASLGNYFTVTLGGNRTLGNPTNAQNGQKLMFRIKQDGSGSKTLALDSKYRLGTDITSTTLSTTANKVDYLGVVYDSTDDKFDVIAFVKGY